MPKRKTMEISLGRPYFSGNAGALEVQLELDSRELATVFVFLRLRTDDGSIDEVSVRPCFESDEDGELGPQISRAFSDVESVRAVLKVADEIIARGARTPTLEGYVTAFADAYEVNAVRVYCSGRHTADDALPTFRRDQLDAALSEVRLLLETLTAR